MLEEELEAYKRASEELALFMKNNEDFMEVLRDLVTERNVRITRVKAALRQFVRDEDRRSYVSGNWSCQRQWSRGYDGETLQKELPAEVFEMCVKEKVEYIVDSDELARLVRRGVISEELQAAAYFEREKTPRVTGPKEYNI